MAAQRDKETEAEFVPSYEKAQILQSQKYAADRDVLQALLEDGRTFSLKQIDELLRKFYNQEAK
ncbi:hypothetical protein [Paenibacillus gansuensis]|uniref:Uncharacterized protein n=1 Tax=Paenibacillus gansuensis TaxID=306542 RepID=A0ABW5PDW0_9BACL